MTPAELVLALQSGRAVTGATPPTVIVENRQNPGGSTCGTTGPTNASVVDSQMVGGQENCEIQFTASNPAGEGVTAKVLRIGGVWYASGMTGVSRATALGLVDNDQTSSSNVKTDFGKGDVNFGGSLTEFGIRTQDGVLTTGLCIESEVAPKVTLVRVDGQGDVCSKQVQKPICQACDDGNAVPTYCFDFCRVLNNYNWIEITIGIDQTELITMNTSAFATANPLVPCA